MIWIPLRRSQLGLSLYAIGSNRNSAAFRSGVAVARTRIGAYALAGLFAAMGGLALTATHRHRRRRSPARTTLLTSVAAVVLGGVALGGGVGGLVGPIVAVFILRLVRTDLTLLGVDPNFATIIEGTIMVVVVMLGAFAPCEEADGMSDDHHATDAVEPRTPRSALHGRPPADRR